MEIKDLMIPRYIVIANYPGSPFKIGQILIERMYENVKIYTNLPIEQEFNINLHDYISIDEIEKCKEIFRKLNWPEYRQTEQMPIYLRSRYKDDINKYIKIIKWYSNIEGVYIKKDGNESLINPCQPGIPYIPITEEEYLTSNK